MTPISDKSLTTIRTALLRYLADTREEYDNALEIGATASGWRTQRDEILSALREVGIDFGPHSADLVAREDAYIRSIENVDNL